MSGDLFVGLFIAWFLSCLALLRCGMLSDRIKELERLTRPRTERTDDMGDC